MNLLSKLLVNPLLIRLAKKLLIALLKRLAERTDNDIDDDLVLIVEKAMNGELEG